MTTSKVLRAAVLGLLCLLAAPALASAFTNVTYDHRALILNGQRRLLVSGCIHYPRSTPGMWPDLLAKAKAGGLDVIETYTFWNGHQPTPEANIFEDRYDVLRFLQACQAAGLYVNLRIGPYVCAEWNYGGLPAWLRKESDMVFRTNNTAWEASMKTWVMEIVKLLKNANMFAPQGGPIILAQIENEYGNWESTYGAGGHEYMLWAAAFANSLDIGVPWIMCQQNDAPDTVINTCNGFYCDNWLSGHFQAYPDQPGFWTENWPGWFQTWGAPKPQRPNEDVAFAVGRWFARGGSLMNYYMYHGGTNFGRTAGGGIVTSYDYDVALDEYGLRREPKYSHWAELHAILHSNEAILMGMNPPAGESLGTDLEAHVYNVTAGCFAFLSNIGTTDAVVEFRGTQYSLPAWSVSFLEDCSTQVFNTATVKAATIMRTMTPAAATTAVEAEVNTGIQFAMDSIGAWGQALTFNAPPEQINTTVDTTDYLWYTTTVNVPSGAGATVALDIESAQDILYVYANNQFVTSVESQSSFSVNIPVAAGATTVTLQLLSVTVGLENYGAFLETIARGIRGSVTFGGQNIAQGQWVVQVDLKGLSQQWYTPQGMSHASWKPLAVNGSVPALSWSSFSLATPSGSAPVALDLSAMGKGMAWVNGHSIGRYWNKIASGGCFGYCNYRGPFSPTSCAEGCGLPSQQYYHVPRDWLVNGGVNSIVLLEEVGGQPGNVQFVTRQSGIVCATVSEAWPQGGLFAQLECDGAQVITAIQFASFGTPTGTCGAFAQSSCSAANSSSIVTQMCLGQTSCRVPVGISEFGDPCPDQSKNLAVQVQCGNA